jgi:hypothetical protein
MGRGFWDEDAWIARPPDPPDLAQEAAHAAMLKRSRTEYEAWQVKHEAWLKEQASNRNRSQTESREAAEGAFKAARRAAFHSAGFSDAEFAAEWPQLLRAYRIEAANARPLEAAKSEARQRHDYSL